MPDNRSGLFIIFVKNRNANTNAMELKAIEVNSSKCVIEFVETEVAMLLVKYTVCTTLSYTDK